AGQPTPIEVDYFDATGNASIALYAKGAVAETIVPSSWLTPPGGALPTGWSLGAAAASGIASADDLGGTVVVTDAVGSSYTYTWTGAAYNPPPGDTSILARDNAGLLV